MPQLSIIIPTFNSGAVLSRALDSIICQTFTDWEVLVMDGVSTDNTLEIANSYNDNRIRIYSEPDKGIYDAMNKGVKKAKGEWCYFMGSEDYFLSPNTLNDLFSKDVWNYDVVYGDVISPILPKAHRGAWSIENLTANRCHQAIFYKHILFQRLGFYSLKYPYLADFEFNLRWFLNKRIKNRYYPIDIAYFSPGGVSEIMDDVCFWKDFDLLVLEYGYSQLNTSQKIFYLTKAIEKEERWIKRKLLSFLLLYNTNKKRMKKVLLGNPKIQ